MTGRPAAALLLDHLDLITGLDSALPVLDLACGKGRNGLALAQRGIAVVFADRSASALEVVDQQLKTRALPGRTWQVDLEQPGIDLFSGASFSAALGFCYLYRPLFPGLMSAVMPGGLVIYETFTIEQLRFGRPHNPDFLLHPVELQKIFEPR